MFGFVRGIRESIDSFVGSRDQKWEIINSPNVKAIRLMFLTCLGWRDGTKTRLKPQIWDNLQSASSGPLILFSSFSVVIPSEPLAVSVSFVNESAAVTTWSSPAVTGAQTHVLYDVECEKSCEYYGKDCDDEMCDGDSHAMKKKGLNMTNVIITNLPSFVKYTCKIGAKNRVSEVAEKNSVKANFTTVDLRTEGSGE